ncbi:hypothetical protein KSP39_PZI008530 [Platanthera zijinensis]|uniref:Uncharacterized protein n=1 Tax=Platanthera zijinensis TaxID=2320716 RepID=A0AAP0BMW9_9ASPA
MTSGVLFNSLNSGIATSGRLGSTKMLSAGVRNPLLSAGFSLQFRPPSLHLLPPICSAALPSVITGGDDRSAGGAPKSNAVSGGRALRGSDILIAMQRAVAQKEIGGSGGGQKAGRKRKKRKGYKSGGEMENLLPADYDYASVRPIQIRGDWGPRIVELEDRLQDLRSRYHF